MQAGGFSRGNPPAHWHSIDTLRDGFTSQLQYAAYAQPYWPSANMAIYLPVGVRSPVLVRALWFANYTTNAGNYDLGLYDSTGAKLLSRGSTAKASSDAMVVWDCTDTVVSPGLYYMALVLSSTSDQVNGNSFSAPYMAAMGAYTEAGALPLPATATFSVPQTLAVCPIMGMLTNTLVS